MLSMFFAFTHKTAAQADYTPLVDLTDTGFFTSYELVPFLVGAFKLAIAAAGVLAVFRIVWGGFTYMTFDSIEGKKDGKEIISKAIGGLILAMAAWLILYTVNKDVLQFKPLEYPKTDGPISYPVLPLPGASGANPPPSVNTVPDRDLIYKYDEMMRQGYSATTDPALLTRERAKELAIQNGISVPSGADIRYTTFGSVPVNITVNGREVPYNGRQYTANEAASAYRHSAATGLVNPLSR